MSFSTIAGVREVARSTALRGSVSLLALTAVASPAWAQTAQDGPSAKTSAGAAIQNQAAQPNDTAQTTQGVAPNTATGAQATAGAQTASGGDVTAAEADTATPEQAAAQTEVVVTGIRASLKSAQAIKQNSDVVVDSISAEDIGALPDRSVTEALQRVPGVTISRFDAGVDPDHFSAQGSGVVVRGLTYTRSELNGRDTFSANNGRGLSFGDVPSELLSGVDVFKSPSADTIEGGIAGTVNLRTRVPFDNKGLLVAGSLEESYSDLAKKSAPTGSILVSDRWHTGIGEFGLLGSFVRSEVFTRTDGEGISNFGARPRGADGVYYELNQLNSAGNTITRADGTTVASQGTYYIPRGARVTTQEYDRIRYGYSAAAQFRSNDERLTATAQFLRSDSRENWNEHAVEIATDNVTSNGDSQPLPGTNFTFDKDNVFTSGTITAPNGYAADQNNVGDNRTPPNGLQSNNGSRAVEQRYVTNDFGFNVKWKATDRLGVNVDYQHVYSRVQNTDFSLLTSSFQNASIVTNGDTPASVNFLPLTTAGVGASTYQNAAHPSFNDPYNSFYRSAMDHIEDSDGHENAAKIDLDYSFPEESWLSSIRAGYRYSDRENTARSSAYNWGVLSEIWGGGALDATGATVPGTAGPVWLTDPVNGNPAVTTGSPGPSTPYLYSGFFGGALAPATGEGRPFVPTSLVQNYPAAVQQALLIAQQWRAYVPGLSGAAGWVPLAQRTGVIAGTPFQPGEINPVSEITHSAYGEVRFGNTLGNGWKFNGNAGVRYVNTERTASGFQSFPAQGFDCTTNAGVAITAFCAVATANNNAIFKSAQAFSNGNNNPIAAKIKYDYWLPSVNARLEVGHGLQFRAAYNQAITPPDFGLTRAYANVTLNTSDPIIQANGAPIAVIGIGNPYLRPIKGDNYDLTAEWYFSQVGSLTLSLFEKELHGVVVNNLTTQTFTNNGATFNALVTTPTNSGTTGHVKGLEVGYQQTYSFLPGILGGLGFAGNFTYVDSSGVPQASPDATDPNVVSGLISTVDTSKLPLQGLSKYSFNVSPFWNYKGIEARAAYTFRSQYLLTVRDVIVPYAPILSADYGQLDASIFYQVTPNLRMGFQGVNLTNSQTETKQVLTDNIVRPRQWFVNDRRYTFSLRFRFGE